MTRKQALIIITIAFFVGPLGSIFFSRLFIPYLSTLPGMSFLSQLYYNAPIIINRREEVQINEGYNLLELTKQAQATAVTIYTGKKPQLKLSGSGLILTSDGLIVTTKQVVGTSNEVVVVLNDGNSYSGIVRALDPKSELVLLTISASGLRVAQFGDAVNLQVGQRLVVLGNTNREFTRKFAYGSVTRTVLNSASLDKVYSSESLENTIETDAKLDPTFMGGPVVNLEGKVVGIVGTNQILLAEHLQPALNSYLSQGKIVRSYWGFRYLYFSDSVAKLHDFVSGGAYVSSVEPSGPAALAGLKAQDYITKVDGESLENRTLEYMLNRESNKELKLELLRAGQRIELKLIPEVK